MMKINSGELNQKVQVMGFTQISDGAGGTVPTESVYWDTFMMAKPWTSRTQDEAQQWVLQDGFKFIARYRVDKSIKADMRLRYRGGLMRIVSNPIDYVYKEYTEFKAVWLNRPPDNE